MAGIKISELNEKKIKNNEDMFEVSYDDGSGYTTYKMKRQRVLELGASDFDKAVTICSGTTTTHIYDLKTENFADIIYVNPKDFVDTANTYYILQLGSSSFPSENNVDDFDIGTSLKIILTGDPVKAAVDRFVISDLLRGFIIPEEDSRPIIKELSKFGYVSLIVSKDNDNFGEKKWFVLDATTITTHTTICDA